MECAKCILYGEIMELIDMKFESEELLALRARNEQRLDAAKTALGTKWVLHPANAPKKIPQAPVLVSKKR